MDDKEGKGVPFVKGSDTSTAAADSMLPHASNIEVQILSYFMHEAQHNGATDDEIEQRFGLKHQTVSARRRQLERKGLVVKMYNHGKRVKRPTRSGRNAGVYVSRRVYNNAHDPTENAPVFFDYSTYELVTCTKKLMTFLDRCVTDLDGSDGVIRNSPQHIEIMVGKLHSHTEKFREKARAVWKEQANKNTLPQ